MKDGVPTVLSRSVSVKVTVLLVVDVTDVCEADDVVVLLASILCVSEVEWLEVVVEVEIVLVVDGMLRAQSEKAALAAEVARPTAFSQ